MELGNFDVLNNQLSRDIRSIIFDASTHQGKFIQGEIPQSMNIFTGMQTLDLSRNKISGEIPHFLETLSLKYLNLSWNDFEGEVAVIGVFANLNAFSVVGNKRICGGMHFLNLPRFESHKHKLSCRDNKFYSFYSSSFGCGFFFLLFFPEGKDTKF